MRVIPGIRPGEFLESSGRAEIAPVDPNAVQEGIPTLFLPREEVRRLVFLPMPIKLFLGGKRGPASAKGGVPLRYSKEA